MTVLRCSSCGKTYVTHPGYCRCGGQDLQSAAVSGKGQVYSCTTLYAAAEPFEKDLPFQIGIIELEDGPRLTARITGPSVKIGDSVNFVEQRNDVYFFSAG